MGFSRRYGECEDAVPVPEKRPFSADQLVDSKSEVFVKKLKFDIDKDPYPLLMLQLIFMVSSERNVGYVRIDLMSTKIRASHKEISIFIRKKSLYIVAVFDGKHLYEIGTSNYRAGYFSDALFTEFREMYVEFFGRRKSLVGIELGRKQLRRCFCQIVTKEGLCDSWRFSLGIFALLFAEPSRFVWILDVLIHRMATEDGRVTLNGQYKWIALLIKSWGDITRVALRERYQNETTTPQRNTHSNAGYDGLFRVKMWASLALIFLHVDCSGDVYGYGGGRGDAGSMGAPGGGFGPLVARLKSMNDQDQAKPTTKDWRGNDDDSYGIGNGGVGGAHDDSFDHVGGASYSSYRHHNAVRGSGYQRKTYVKITKKWTYGMN